MRFVHLGCLLTFVTVNALAQTALDKYDYGQSEVRQLQKGTTQSREESSPSRSYLERHSSSNRATQLRFDSEAARRLDASGSKECAMRPSSRCSSSNSTGGSNK